MRSLGRLIVLYCTVSVITSFRQSLQRSRNNRSLATAMLLRITFDNQNLRKLPLDPKKFVSGESRQVPNAVFSRVDLQPVQNPRLIAKSRGALELLGLPSGDDDTSESDLTPYLSGNLLIPGSLQYLW